MSTLMGYTVAAKYAPGLKPFPHRLQTAHMSGDYDEFSPNPYRLTYLEQAKFNSHGLQCWTRESSSRRHRNVDLGAITKAVKGYCAAAAQTYGVDNKAMIQFPTSNVADYLNFNDGWQRYTVYDIVVNEYVSVQIRQAFGIQDDGISVVYPVSVEDCSHLLIGTAKTCSSPGEQGTGKSSQ